MRVGGIGLVIIAFLLAILVVVNKWVVRLTPLNTNRYIVIVGAVLGVIGLVMVFMSMRKSASNSAI
jgi:uncharacterized membrane protein YqjE